jgi:hypothetical protein
MVTTTLSAPLVSFLRVFYRIRYGIPSRLNTTVRYGRSYGQLDLWTNKFHCRPETIGDHPINSKALKVLFFPHTLCFCTYTSSCPSIHHYNYN